MDELLAQLESIKDKVNSEFPGQAARDRLAQFNAHIATVGMLVEALYDESTRMEGYK